ncbi:MAG: nucleotidyltransferase domain-containing protein [candidate division WOR-3 bacterium]|nr:nucleotidyltransferase domain-containing protein [candidate division WOR-3 bacterium]
MPVPSSTTVRVFSLNRDQAVGKLRRLAAELVAQNQNVTRVLLFGSLATDSYSPHSDADLLVVLAEDERRRMDRTTEFILHFLPAGCPTDVLVYTEAELEREKNEPFLRRVLGQVVPLAVRAGQPETAEVRDQRAECNG